MPARRLTVFFLLISTFSCQENASSELKNETLPLCEHLNPHLKLEEWLKLAPLTVRKCNHSSQVEKSEEEKKIYNDGIRAFAFDVVASDRMGPIRDPGYQAHPLEIILYEDASEEAHRLTEPLKKAVEIEKWSEIVQIHRSEERQGLIRAKSLASRLATGDVLIFLDSHCEVTEDWLGPLLQPIVENPKSVVIPVVDLINPGSFDYSKAMVAKSGFDWALNFRWEYIPWDYFDDEKNNVRPFVSPSMPGGLLAIRTDWFRQLGEYDQGMEIWGAENVELSLKTWMCGGRVVVAPCSRIGHVFRMFRPYKSKPGLDTNVFNSLRVAKAWLGDYEKYFLEARLAATKLDPGDVSHAELIKKSLGCRDMNWYIENVYPQLKPVKHEEL